MAFQPTRRKTPGSHIAKQGKTQETRPKHVELHLTSMIDMFTILLVFLLKNFSAEGEIMAISEDLKLPEASFNKKPVASLIVAVTKEFITLEGEHIIEVKEIINTPELVIPKLKERLEAKANYVKEIAKINPTIIFTGDVTIQGDKAIPFKLLQKIMYTCGQAEYNNIKLATLQKED